MKIKTKTKLENTEVMNKYKIKSIYRGVFFYFIPISIVIECQNMKICMLILYI